MRILVGWDNPTEAELLSLYLDVLDNQVTTTTDAETLADQASRNSWDVVLLTISEARYELFQKLRRLHPETPVVGACHPQDVYRMARFMTGGMRSYALRDPGGDYIFLLHSLLESAVETVRAEREQKIAERLREEIESVRKLQESIIPHNLYCPRGYEICARYEPSQIQVMGGRPVILAGGDYYDVFALDENTVVLLVGDASGHGMKACMSIMTMHTLVRMIRGEQYRDTAAFVAEVNRRLCEQSVVHEDGGFITLLYGVLRADRHELQWTAAGHPLPLLQQLENGVVEQVGSQEVSGLPLGIFADAEYQTVTSTVPPNSRLLLYTDGLVEALGEGEVDQTGYGIEGVVKTLTRCRPATLGDALQSLFHDSHQFTGGTGRHDDTSVVLLQRL